ncbi:MULTISPECIES: ABC transporter substrate-binding protein [unclassified Streptomyces]|uniref:ABC transporter substrate-binding protein n=1 Tax=unclassified Streptomyces TaxID=2593676 RepID=UPI0022564336|nr:ABC transporter substrate-binding protein [Streptomyces sp. NBC_00401]MCX5079812.1 ABC transporter substrate-binding protein [Streptomyces sp. NBC_00401]
MKYISAPRHAAAAVLACAATVVLAGCGAGDARGGEPASRDKSADIAVARDATLHAALPERIRKAGTVRVATDVPYPPFAMFVAAGKSDLTGLDYDLGQALGAKLGVTFAFTPTKFDGIVPAIQAGKFDVAMSALTDNREREKLLDFVDYSRSGSGILVAEGNPQKIVTLDDLCGGKVGVQAATNQHKLLSAHQSACRSAGHRPADIQTFPKDSDAQLALRSGKVSAVVVTKPAAGWAAKTADGGKAFDLAEDPEAPAGYRASPNGIAVSKQLPRLTSAIRRALQDLMDDGTLNRICAKYGVAGIALKQATENAAVD